MQGKYRRQSVLLLAGMIGIGAGLAVWKYFALSADKSAVESEAAEVIATTTAQSREFKPITTSIGTVVALRSIVLRNELPGTVHRVALAPGAIIEAGAILVEFDTSVEQAELAAQQAEANLAQTRLQRAEKLIAHAAVSAAEVDAAQAQLHVARAQIERTKAIIARKILRAPFRVRVGIADVHPGQYLDQGTQLTTLQGIDDALYVDFVVTQHVAAGLHNGDSVEIESEQENKSPQENKNNQENIRARIVAVDARVDAKTRNTTVRARIDNKAELAPGAAVRVRTTTAPAQTVVAIPASALRRGPEGDHVFVIAQDQAGNTRAHMRRVRVGVALGDEILIEEGLTAGERVAAAGAFKLRDAALVIFAAANTEAATLSTAADTVN